TTASAPDEPAHPAEPPEKVVSVATDKDWREFEAELSQPEKNEVAYHQCLAHFRGVTVGGGNPDVF
ncbi:hypothetical protein ACSLO8_31180, partial [Escherichia coli]